MSTERDLFYQTVKEIVHTEVKNLGLMEIVWHLGVVKEVKNNNILGVCIDASTFQQDVPCNPNVEFYEGDRVWIVFVNGDSMNKFCLAKRAVL